MESFMIVGIFSFVIILGFVIYNIIRFNNLPVESCKARVIRKRISRRGSNNGRSYYITFETEKGCIEIRARSYVYHSIIEGKEGTLFYKGNVLVDFQ